jgi:hypothetical protein
MRLVVMLNVLLESRLPDTGVSVTLGSVDNSGHVPVCEVLVFSAASQSMSS